MDDKEQLQNNLISIDINVFDSNIVNYFLLNDTGDFLLEANLIMNVRIRKIMKEKDI